MACTNKARADACGRRCTPSRLHHVVAGSRQGCSCHAEASLALGGVTPATMPRGWGRRTVRAPRPTAWLEPRGGRRHLAPWLRAARRQGGRARRPAPAYVGQLGLPWPRPKGSTRAPSGPRGHAPSRRDLPARAAGCCASCHLGRKPPRAPVPWQAAAPASPGPPPGGHAPWPCPPAAEGPRPCCCGRAAAPARGRHGRQRASGPRTGRRGRHTTLAGGGRLHATLRRGCAPAGGDRAAGRAAPTRRGDSRLRAAVGRPPPGPSGPATSMGEKTLTATQKKAACALPSWAAG